MFLDQGTQTTYPCPICHELEPVLVPPMEVRRIVLADSTLHGVWNQTLPPNILHFDIDVIVGGKVRDLTRAFEKNYQHMPNRMEIVVVAGLNIIGAGETAYQIIKEMGTVMMKITLKVFICLCTSHLTHNKSQKLKKC